MQTTKQPEDMRIRKLCPLMQEYCKTKCAWFIHGANQCSVRQLATELRRSNLPEGFFRPCTSSLAGGGR